MNRVTVLDHGFVVLRNLAGPTRRTQKIQFDPPAVGPAVEFDADDTDPANAARMSFNMTDSETVTLKDGTTRPRTRDDDLKLCDFLIKNWHNSPFEMVVVWLEMKLPIFVARQFVRHRTVSINEVSGRYVTLPAEWYIPQVVGGKPIGGAKQGQSDTLDALTQRAFKEDLNFACEQSYQRYLMHMAKGVAPEHARMFLHLNHYTHWLWKQDMHNMLHFLQLRDHSHAQVEAQLYARAIDVLLRRQLPNTMSLYDKYRRQKPEGFSDQQYQKIQDFVIKNGLYRGQDKDKSHADIVLDLAYRYLSVSK
jgi:thymidylate synthase (FAD)